MNKELSQSQISRRLRTCIKECNFREKKYCAVCKEFAATIRQQQDNPITDSAERCNCFDGLNHFYCDWWFWCHEKNVKQHAQ